MDIFLRRRNATVLLLTFLLVLGGVLFYFHASFTLTEATQRATEFSYDIYKPSKTFHRDCNETCESYLQRVDNYCHQDLLNLWWQQELAHEGRLDSKDNAAQFELVHAHVVLRHGDRTPVYPYKIGSPIFYECGLTDTKLNWNGLYDFPPILSLPPSASLQNRFLKLNPGVSSRRCGEGMLTQLGFKQLRSLGTLLQTRYRPFMNNFTASRYSARDVFVHSTDVRRTMQSAAAFLVGFLPNYVSVRRAVRMHVSSGTYNHPPPPGIEEVYSSCRGYFDFLDTELKKTGYYKTERLVFHPLLEKVCEIFHLPNPNQPIVNRIVDHFMTRGCHNPGDPLPCYRDQCLDFPYALKMLDYSDWNWRHKLPTDSSTVRMLPFLRHSVLEPMKKRVAGDTKDEAPFTFKFMLTLTHDDALMMMLKVLGHPLDVWIPYASRIVFEVWRSDKHQHYVRVLYNGEVISGKTLPGKEDGGANLVNGELVRFEKWREFLTTGPFRDINTYNRVCKN